jgi:hypothetical protein
LNQIAIAIGEKFTRSNRPIMNLYLINGDVQLRFTLKNADLFSLRFE